MAVLFCSGKYLNNKLKLSFFRTRMVTSIVKYSQLDELQDICKNIEKCFKNKSVEILKHDISSTVINLLSGTKKFVIRRDNFKNIFKAIKRIFSKSRSRKLWEKGNRLNQHGFRSLEPLALIEDYVFFIKNRSYIIYEYLEGVTFKEYFSNPELSRLERDRISGKLVEAIESWHATGVTHGDPKAGNVLVNDGEIYFIDVEDIKWPQNRLAWRHAVARDKGIVLHNLQTDLRLREIYCRKFFLDYPYGMKYFGRWLIEKFWKSEYEVLRKEFSGQVDGHAIIKNIINNKIVEGWIYFQKPGNLIFGSALGSSKFILVSLRAFVFLKDLKGYFQKPRVPHRGIFSMIVSLGICSFSIPKLVDAGVFLGKEYVLFEKHCAETFFEVLQKIGSEANKRRKLIQMLAQEIGRLHATGFAGVIEGFDNIFVETKGDGWKIGFSPSNNVSFQSIFCPKKQKKEVEVLVKELSCELSLAEMSDFVMEYNELMKRA